jgi:DNA processing protein
MNLIETKNLLLHLSLINGINERIINIITKKYSFIKNFYHFSIKDFMNLNISEEKSKIIYTELQNKKILDDEIYRIQKNKITWVTPYETEYPKNLLSLDTIPPIIYHKHTAPICWNDKKWLGIVSSRKTNSYGKKIISQIIERLSQYDVGIISGGAIGGDTFVHTEALVHRMPNVAILGCGLEFTYPLQNERLFEKMIHNNGALVSHFSMSQKATHYTFPIRNSIIAGLCDALLVIQAGEKSGTLITAQYALDFNKTVAAIPGNIDDELSFGSNNLIRNGAESIVSYDDIFEILNIKQTSEIEKIPHIHDPQLSQPSTNTYSTHNHNEITNLCEKILLETKAPRTIHELALLCNIDLTSAQETLYDLMLEGRVSQDSLGRWIHK